MALEAKSPNQTERNEANGVSERADKRERQLAAQRRPLVRGSRSQRPAGTTRYGMCECLADTPALQQLNAMPRRSELCILANRSAFR
jgi:hypothetical protein